MNVITEIYGAVFGGLQARPGPSLVEKLPQDIIVLILQSIDSLRSLRAAVLAASAMNDAFKTAKIETLACVVAHSRPKEIEEDAVALSVVMSMQLQKNPKVMNALLLDNLSRPRKKWQYLPRDLASPRLLHFHWFVEYFSEKIFKSSMRRTHRMGWSGTDKLRFRKLSHNETVRIQRALYRLEFFNSVIRLDVLGGWSLKSSPYWRNKVFVWDMEEVSCVYDLLSMFLVDLDKAILSALQRINVFDNSSAPPSARSKKLLSFLISTSKNVILSQGLPSLFRLLSRPESLQTYKTIHEILRPTFKLSNGPADFSVRQLVPGVEVFMRDTIFERSHPQQPFKLDPDKVKIPQDSIDYPSFGWLLAYSQKTAKLAQDGTLDREQSYFYREHHFIQNWGYCLWDQVRLETWGVEGFTSGKPRLRRQF